MKFKYILPIFITAALLSSCGAHADKAAGADTPGDTITLQASLLTIVRHESCTEVLVRDPWQAQGALLSHLYLVPRAEAPVFDAPQGCTVVPVPVERSVVFSSVHTAPLFEIGAGEALTGVADGQYFAEGDTVRSLLSSGHLVDVGSSSSPSVEQILALEAEAVLLSPMQGSDNSIMSRSGIAVIPMADYMESTPLGRAEWIRLIGALYGCSQQADSIYADVCARYGRLCAATRNLHRPRVLTENLTSGVWYVPAGDSYMARMLADAGADYPWASVHGEGSLPPDAAAVLDKAADADFWLMRTFGPAPARAALAKDNPAAAHIKAFGSGNVFVCDTSVKPIFNDIAFHPERVLADFVAIFHPEAVPGAAPAYYEKL